MTPYANRYFNDLSSSNAQTDSLRYVLETAGHGQHLRVGSSIDPTPFQSREVPLTQKPLAISMVPKYESEKSQFLRLRMLF